MGKIGYGYGSEWHLLRYLGYHRHELSAKVGAAIGAGRICWLDFPREGEWKGLDFLPDNSPAKNEWKTFWPQTGNMHNWDAVGVRKTDAGEEYLLVEAKAHIKELNTKCGARDQRSIQIIEEALRATRKEFGADETKASNWLNRYYQYANRLAVLYFMREHDIPAHLVFICFLGDSFPARSNIKCPKTEAPWHKALADVHKRLGLSDAGLYKERVHHLYPPIYPQKIARKK